MWNSGNPARRPRNCRNMRFQEISKQEELILQRKREIEEQLNKSNDAASAEKVVRSISPTALLNVKLSPEEERESAIVPLNLQKGDEDVMILEDPPRETEKEMQARLGNKFLNDGSFLAKFKRMQNVAQMGEIAEQAVEVSEKPVETDLPVIDSSESIPSSSPAPALISISKQPCSGQSKLKVFSGPCTSSTDDVLVKLEDNDGDDKGSSPVENEIRMAIEKTAISVAMNGPDAENSMKLEMKDKPNYGWLTEQDSTNYKYYLRRVEELTLAKKRAKLEDGEETNVEGKSVERKKVKKSRWDDGPAEVKSVTTVAVPQDIGLVQYAMEVYGRTELEPDQWKQLEDQRKMKILYQMLEAKQMETKRLAAAGRVKYEYDSDEEIDEGGTWEHKRRKEEMGKTKNWADELSGGSRGRHHIGDFMPPEELERFIKKWDNIKDGQTSILIESDYQEFKVQSDNIGYKMLQKMGWSEGQGLGSNTAESITEPINKATPAIDGGGMGLPRPEQLKQGDDEYEAYRKRMMLSYKFRPNPLNNPRRSYY